MKHKYSFLVLAVLLAFLSLNAHALQRGKIDNIIKKVESKYKDINDLHAQFEQRAEIRALGTEEVARGEVWFKKPYKMRWDYHKPYKDKIVSDGKTLWFYNEQEKQVMKSSLKKLTEQSNSTTLLSGLAKLSELFKATFSSDPKITPPKNSYLIELKPKSTEETFNRLLILVDKKDFLVKKIYIFDNFGNITTITLDEFRFNSKLSDSLFEFKPPKGVEVVDLDSRK